MNLQAIGDMNVRDHPTAKHFSLYNFHKLFIKQRLFTSD